MDKLSRYPPAAGQGRDIGTGLHAYRSTCDTCGAPWRWERIGKYLSAAARLLQELRP